MENMGIYFKDEQKKERWETGQAILHKEDAQNDTEQKSCGIKNSYGRLHYLKKGEKQGEEREGLSLEAFEAPGTPLHTEKEKHLDRAAMKNVTHGDKQMLFSSELPLRNQALFYDLTGSKKSEDFLECMKQLIRTRGHRTLNDTFGFLNQEAERRELEFLKKEQEESVLDGFDYENKNADSKREDVLNGRLLRKEAKERQLRSDLQLMLEQQSKEQLREGMLGRLQADLEQEQEQKTQKPKDNDNPLQRHQSGEEASQNQTEDEPILPEDDEEELH